MADLDAKYIHSSQPDSTANRGVKKAQSTLNDLTTSFNKSSYLSRLSQYFEKAANHPYGIKIHRFYESLGQDVREVHEEAKRLTELRKERAMSNARLANLPPMPVPVLQSIVPISLIYYSNYRL